MLTLRVRLSFLALAFLGVGCDSQGTSAENARARQALGSIVTEPGQSAINAIFARDTDLRLGREVEIHRQRGACLQAEGWKNPYPVPTRQLVEREQRYTAYRDLSRAEAEAHGYGFQSSAAPEPGEGGYVNSLDPVQRLAFLDASNRCTQAAVTSVLPNLGRYSDLMARLSELYVVELQRTESTDEFRALEQAFGDCMRSAGFPVTSPAEARELAETRMERARLTGGDAAALREERNVAVQDATCRAQVDYSEGLFRMLRAADERFLDEHAALVLEAAQAWNTAGSGSSPARSSALHAAAVTGVE